MPNSNELEFLRSFISDMKKENTELRKEITEVIGRSEQNYKDIRSSLQEVRELTTATNGDLKLIIQKQEFETKHHAESLRSLKEKQEEDTRKINEKINEDNKKIHERISGTQNEVKEINKSLSNIQINQSKNGVKTDSMYTMKEKIVVSIFIGIVGAVMGYLFSKF